VGTKVAAGIAAGKVKVEYHVVSFLDRASKNDYSSRAANALYAVADTAGPEAFQKMHDLLYQNQPAEGSAGPEDDQLIAWAVEAGADKAKVTPLINDDQFGQFVQNATDQMSKDGVHVTPGIFIDRKFQTDISAGVQAVLDAVK
jgi:protein-disulfide isomerase